MRRLVLASTYLLLIVAMLFPAQSWAAFAHSATTTYEHGTPGAGTSHTFANTANVAANSLLVLCVKNNSSSGVATFDSATGAGGSDTFTMLTNQTHSGNNPFDRCSYKLASSADASYAPTMTFSASVVHYIRAVLFVFTYTGTASFDTEVGSTEDSADTTPSSNNISPNPGSDGVCVVAHADNGSQTITASSETLNGVAGSGVTKVSNDTDFFYRILTTGFTNGVSTLTRSTARNWIQRIACFKTDAGGGAPATNFFRARIRP